MPKLLANWVKSKTSDAANKVMQALYATKKPMFAKDLWQVVRMDLEKPTDLSQILHNLEQADKLQVIHLDEKRHGYLPKQKVIGRQLLYVDRKYLNGKEVPGEMK